MNQLETYRRVINKLLNFEMKRKYGYHDLIFYLNPIQYISNREFVSYYGFNEIVTIYFKNPKSKYRSDRLNKDVKNCLNHILPFVEGGGCKRISSVLLKINQ
jgi:hypothetical protein